MKVRCSATKSLQKLSHLDQAVLNEGLKALKSDSVVGITSDQAEDIALKKIGGRIWPRVRELDRRLSYAQTSERIDAGVCQIIYLRTMEQGPD